MENLLEKFNVFDLFTMLIPGIIISTLLYISLSFKYYDQWKDYGKEKYIIFFVISYLFGIFFQQIGNIIDEMWLYKIIYGGNPKETFLLKDQYMKVLDNEFVYKDALNVKDYLLRYLNINNKNLKTIKQEKQFNARIFSYCLNIVEINGLSYKSDKMLVISEMSRSLSLGCIAIFFLNVFMCLFCHFHYKFYIVESILLLFLCIIFLYRKVQYEKYRYRIVLRMFLILVNKNNNK